MCYSLGFLVAIWNYSYLYDYLVWFDDDGKCPCLTWYYSIARVNVATLLDWQLFEMGIMWLEFQGHPYDDSCPFLLFHPSVLRHSRNDSLQLRIIFKPTHVSFSTWQIKVGMIIGQSWKDSTIMWSSFFCFWRGGTLRRIDFLAQLANQINDYEEL